MPAGHLFVVSTPIGNLEDITYRAVRVLRDADLVACEDTRHSRKLLDHYGIGTRLISYHEHNESERAAALVERMLAGEDIALISDAGTPLVSDPGYRLVLAAVRAGVRVVPVPGPSAVLSALAASGLPTDSFFFGGFLPAKSGQRRRELERLRGFDWTLVFYEAPHRVVDSLKDVAEVMGARPVVLTRELTKVHEETLRGDAAAIARELEARESVKGEITLLIGKAAEPEPDDTPVSEAVEKLVAAGMPAMEAIKAVARDRGLPKRDVYAEYERRRR